MGRRNEGKVERSKGGGEGEKEEEITGGKDGDGKEERRKEKKEGNVGGKKQIKEICFCLIILRSKIISGY